MSDPAIAVPTNAMVMDPLTLAPCKCEITPAAELATMMSSEVPIAIGISTPSINTRAGMMRKPPPTPNSPVNRPTRKPAGMDLGTHRRQLIPSFPTLQAVPVSPRSTSIRTPAAIITAAKPIMIAGCGRWRPIAVPTKVAGIPAAAKTAASRHWTWWARTFGRAPTGEARAITIRESGMACWMSSPKAYTSAGTARIDPPPPSNPSSTPITAPRASASVMVTMVVSASDAWRPESDLPRVGGLAEGIDCGLQFDCGVVGDLPQSGPIGELDHNLRVHCVDDHRIIAGSRVGAHNHVARQQQSDLTVDIHSAVR